MPSNPLFSCPDLKRLSELADSNDFPIVVDETIGSFHNLDVSPAADLIVSSLTKFFSGAGDAIPM